MLFQSLWVRDRTNGSVKITQRWLIIEFDGGFTLNLNIKVVVFDCCEYILERKIGYTLHTHMVAFLALHC